MEPQASPKLTDISEDLFEVLGFADAPDEEKAALMIQMVEVVQTRVFDKVYQMISSEKQDEFMHVLEDEDVTKMEKFLETSVPDYESLFDIEAKNLRHQLIVKLAV